MWNVYGYTSFFLIKLQKYLYLANFFVWKKKNSFHHWESNFFVLNKKKDKKKKKKKLLSMGSKFFCVKKKKKQPRNVSVCQGYPHPHAGILQKMKLKKGP